MTITPETLAELRRLLDAGTGLPWHWNRDYARPMLAHGSDAVLCCSALLGPVASDAELITGAVNALPALMEAAVEVEPLREWVEELKGERDSVYAAMTRAHVENAALRANLAEATAEREALAASVARVREGHTPYPDYLPGPNGFPVRWERCQRCNGAYPCQPIRALDGSES